MARGIIRYTAHGLLGLAVLGGGLFGFIQTPPGKSLLASTASWLASGNGLEVRISDIDGFVPSDLKVGRIELADSKGTFATIEGIDFTWAPMALISGLVSADNIAARKISLQRLPELPPAPENASGSALTLPRIDLKRLAFSEIDIAAPVFGQAMQLSFAGSAHVVDPAQGLALDFGLDRTDLPGRIAGKVNYILDTRVLDIDVVADEPSGGLISGLAQIEGRPPVNLALKGKGSLDDFKATLSLAAGEAITAQGSASIERDQMGRAVLLDLKGALAGLLPANLRPLFEGDTTLNARLHVDDAKVVRVDDVKLQAAGLGATLKGSVDTNGNTAQLRFRLIGGDAARYATLAPGVQWQDWFVDGSLTGPLGQPAVKAAVTLNMPRAEGYGAEVVSATIEALPQTDGAFAITADGNARGLEAADPKVTEALGDTLDFVIAGALGSDGKPQLTGATIKLAPLAAEFTGRATPVTAQGKLRLNRLDLAALSPLAGRSLGGQITAEADLDMTADILRVTGKGSSTGIVTGIAAVDGLLNGATELTGSVERGSDGVLVVKDANLSAKNLALAVGGRIDRSTADLKADLTLADMALIDPRVSGKVQATAAFSGTLDKLALNSKLSIASGTAMGKPVEGLEVIVTAADLTGAPQGDLSFDGRVAGKPAKGLVRFATLPENAYRLDPIDITVGANQVKGTLSTAGSLITGDLVVDAPDLSDLSALALTPMAGSLKGTVKLSAEDGKQAAVANATLSLAAGETITAQGSASIERDQTGQAVLLDLKGALAGLLPANLRPLFEGDTTLNARLHVDDAKLVRVDDVKLQAAGLGATLKGSVDTNGNTAQLRFRLIGGDAARYATLAPGVQWQDWFVDGSLDGPLGQPAVKAALTLTMPRAQGYGAEMFGATIEALPQADGAFAITADGNARGLEAADPKVAEALGDTLDFAIAGALGSDGKPALTGATIKLAPLAAEFTGRATPEATQGKLRLSRLDLAALSPLAGRSLGGQITAEADLDMTPDALRVAGKGSSTGIVTGIAAVDGLLNGPTELAGSVERGSDGVLVVKDTNLSAKNLALAVGGRIDRSTADLKADLTLADMALIDPRVSGNVHATAAFSGTLDKLALNSKLSIASGTAMGKPIEGLEVIVAAADLTGAPQGDLSFDGRVAGKPAKGMVRFATLPENAYRLDPIDLTVGANQVKGTISTAGSLITGDLVVDAPDLSDLSALALTPMAGSLKGTVKLSAEGGKQAAVANATLSLAAGETITAQGSASIERDQTGRAVLLDLKGALAGLLPGNLRPLFEGDTTLNARLHVDDAKVVRVDDVKLQAAGLGATLKGSVDTNGNTAQLRFRLIGGDAARYATLAPGVQWQDWFVDGSLTGPLGQPAVKAAVTLNMPRAEGYGAEVVSATIEALPQTDGAFAITADGNARGLEAADPKVTEALGDTLDFVIAGALGSDGKPQLTGATIKLAPLAAEFTGRATPVTAQGKLRLNRLDLAALSPLAGRSLGGQITAEADLDMTADILRVTGKGSSTGIVTGIAAVDGLLNGATELTGSVERGSDGVLVVKDANLSAKNLALAVGGRIDRSAADLKADLTLADMALIDPRVSGKVQATAAFSGTLDKLALNSKLSIASGTAMGKPVEGLEVIVTAADLTGAPQGDLSFDGRVAGKPAKGLVRFATLPENAYRLDPIDITVGANQVKGTLSTAGSLITGDLVVDAPDLSDLSALALTPMAGSLKGTVKLSAEGGKQAAVVKATASAVRVAEQGIGRATVDGTVSDAFGTPGFVGTIVVADSTAGGVRIERANIDGSGTAADSTIRLAARVEGTDVTSEARVRPSGATTVVDLRSLALAKGGVRANLAGPSRIEITGSDVAIDNFVLVTGRGRAAVSGRAGKDRLALDVRLAALPLSLARLGGYQGELNGTLEGTITVAGSPTSPTGRYDIRIAGLSNPDIVRSGSGPFDISANGDLRDQRAMINMTIRNRQIQDARVTGSISLPQMLLDLRVVGGVQLSLANPMLAASGNRLAGRAQINATVTGKASEPNLGGTIRLVDARFDDVVNGVSISKINGDIVGSGRSLVLQNIRGQTVNGGRVTLTGRVTVDPAAGLPADIAIAFDKATLISSDTARLVADGRLQASGPLMLRPKIAGRVQVRRLDINLPDRLSGAARPIEVRHIGAPPGRRLAGARPGAAAKAGPARPARAFIADLDLTLSAPNGIFVRGMGIEAELGGNLSLRGTSAEPRSLGGFEFRRGRFDGFGQRLDFSRGIISFNGSLDPELDFVAQTVSGGITAKVLITGPASQPRISFASTPTLPQDEVIARLLFNRGASELTMSQAAQLAQTIAQLSGSGPGMLDKLRQSLGVDSLDVDTENGGSVGMGKRINDRVYLGVKQGAQPNSSKVTIDLDITRNIRAQGAAGADGSTEVGVGAEWDY
ncbi:hypothetical protein G5V57_33565 [Nordella sp. HKS 07]|uniref:translocation/assembly module TamB domain-containing protein n=1 Tax=Nordella sp. HKS 07 TaxID=2712222 RepID=UPI0013E193CD|nr:translocation/assembly module TamB domain-containing protein [Nordella sp. HKS 07]QIG52198.1 hypothetical protein G5V57_33565 [Nordella sp. HKS 07]